MLPAIPAIRLTMLSFLGALVALPLMAQDIPNLREARRLVFSPRGAVEVEVIPHESLSEIDMAVLNSDQIAAALSYYGAMAIAPGMGLASEATTAYANFHNSEAAIAAALEGCNAARTSGPECVVVLVVRPDGWEPGRSLQLNSQATAALRGEFRRMDRPRLLAISDVTGNWGMGADEETAVANCGHEDCRVVVID